MRRRKYMYSSAATQCYTPMHIHFLVLIKRSHKIQKTISVNQTIHTADLMGWISAPKTITGHVAKKYELNTRKQSLGVKRKNNSRKAVLLYFFLNGGEKQTSKEVLLYVQKWASGRGYRAEECWVFGSSSSTACISGDISLLLQLCTDWEPLLKNRGGKRKFKMKAAWKTDMDKSQRTESNIQWKVSLSKIWCLLSIQLKAKVCHVPLTVWGEVEHGG